MAAPVIKHSSVKRPRGRQATAAKAETLLAAAAALIAEKGFEATALRDVGRELEVSLGGMYYYFSSKDDLLYQIQSRTFASLLDAQTAVAARPEGAERRLERLLAGHLGFFARHPNEMKICTYELESLKGEPYERVLAIRRRYYRLVADTAAELVDGKKRQGRETTRSRHVTLFIFGMLNWAFMWYRPEKDGTVDELAGEMMGMILHGVGRSR